jgi:hypothetical protein
MQLSPHGLVYALFVPFLLVGPCSSVVGTSLRVTPDFHVIVRANVPDTQLLVGSFRREDLRRCTHKTDFCHSSTGLRERAYVASVESRFFSHTHALSLQYLHEGVAPPVVSHDFLLCLASALLPLLHSNEAASRFLFRLFWSGLRSLLLFR